MRNMKTFGVLVISICLVFDVIYPVHAIGSSFHNPIDISTLLGKTPLAPLVPVVNSIGPTIAKLLKPIVNLVYPIVKGLVSILIGAPIDADTAPESVQQRNDTRVIQPFFTSLLFIPVLNFILLFTEPISQPPVQLLKPIVFQLLLRLPIGLILRILRLPFELLTGRIL